MNLYFAIRPSFRSVLSALLKRLPSLLMNNGANNRPYLNYLPQGASGSSSFNVFQQGLRPRVPRPPRPPPFVDLDTTVTDDEVTILEERHSINRSIGGVRMSATEEIRMINRTPQSQIGAPRTWESARPPSPSDPNAKEMKNRSRIATKAKVEFNIVSYNVLCQETIFTTNYLYHHCRRGELEWPHRWNLLQKEINLLNADIYCLQEVQDDHYENFFKPFMESRGYVGFFKKRTGAKPDGCASFYRKEKFDLIESRPIEYFIPQSNLLDRGNVGLILSLRPRIQGKVNEKLIIANTHLLYNPHRGDIKLAQLSILLAHIDQMASISPVSSVGYHPVILCGDFNMEPLCPMYEFLMSGQIQYYGQAQYELSGQGKVGGRTLNKQLLPQQAGVTDTCELSDLWAERILQRNTDMQRNQAGSSLNADPLLSLPISTGQLSHRLQLMSVYRHITASNDFEVSSYHKDASSVDYIFYSLQQKTAFRRSDDQFVCRDIIEGKLKCLQRLGLLGERDLEKSVGKLPNSHCGSDHLPLMAKFEMDIQ